MEGVRLPYSLLITLTEVECCFSIQRVISLSSIIVGSQRRFGLHGGFIALVLRGTITFTLFIG